MHRLPILLLIPCRFIKGTDSDELKQRFFHWIMATKNSYSNDLAVLEILGIWQTRGVSGRLIHTIYIIPPLAQLTYSFHSWGKIAGFTWLLLQLAIS